MTHCERLDLQGLLNDSLPEVTEQNVASHLADCPHCQRELEALAAGAAWWSEASQRLSKISAAASSRLRSTDKASSDADDLIGPETYDDDAAHFAADFAVDFLEPSDDATKLGRLGDYEIVEVIGRGGMGIVLKGFQPGLNRYVAVKVLAPHLASSGAARRRFAREAQATAAIVHPHVMAIHSVHANVKLPYLVMPFVACESLQQRLDRQGPLDLKDILRIGRQAALGLAAAHAQGLVHRDVKPANILLETNVDRVMLTDFGLARAVDDATLTRSGVIAGTPQYMSPEQANGDIVDHRSDLFSLGSVLYAMCTGRPPFRSETTFGVLRRIRETAPRSIREINADIPVWLEQLVMRLLSKSSHERFESADKVASLLEQSLAHVQQPSTALPMELTPSPSRANVPIRGVVIAATMTLVLAAVVAIRPWISTRQQAVSQSTNTDHSTESQPTPHTSTDPPLEWNFLRTEIEATDKLMGPLEATAQQSLNSLTSESPEQPSSDRQEGP